jgi:hypothetical protein
MPPFGVLSSPLSGLNSSYCGWFGSAVGEGLSAAMLQLGGRTVKSAQHNPGMSAIKKRENLMFHLLIDFNCISPYNPAMDVCHKGTPE